MSKVCYKYCLLLVGMILTACSTTKNTWGTRAYHQTKVKYNIFFNGNQAFVEGQKSIREAAKDDYTDILYLYPISDHDAAQAAAGKMDVTIEKCRKCIKIHSIKKKPKINSKRMNDPKYRAWLKQEEFNNQMGRVWVRLGEAEFHKGDFLGSIGTFNYVQKHFDYDRDMVAQCQLWTARAYAEMGWLYEAEDMLQRVQVDDLKRKNASLYSSASADVLLKAGRYREAIPFVKLALPYESRRLYRPRFQYVLAQLLERDGKRQEAAEAYGRVLRLTPPLEMEFNAKIRKAELDGRASLRSLEKMARLDKHKDQLDRIYGTIGNIYLNTGDTAAALENYQLAIEKSTRNGSDKAEVLLRAGDLYFDRGDYAQAQPCYNEVVTILSAESEDYKRIYRRSEALDQLILATTTIQLQDSLQMLSTKSEAEQLRIVNEIIAALIEKEKNDSVAAAQAARDAENDFGLNSVDTRNMLGGGGQSANWYFYNATLLKQGKQDFRKRWGNRPLEDDWRRQSKSVSAIPNDDMGDDMAGVGLDSLSVDSMASRVPTPVTDTHSPQYYLQQIPRTPEDIHRSDSLIADALYELIFIYQDQLADTVLALQTFQEFQQRFVSDPRLPDLYYMFYLSALKRENQSEATKWRDRIISLFPQSPQARIVSDPNYFAKLRRMALEQDSLYESTYVAYKKGQFTEVKTAKIYAEENYPLSPLMPRFLFLNAIAVARTQGQEAFVESLSDLVERYPVSEMGSMAKEMLAMMGQGMSSKKGEGTTNLADARTGEAPIEEEPKLQLQFSTETKGSSYVLLCMQGADEQMLNDLLYEVALFNFSQFLIKDFDLQVLMTFDSGSAIRIGGMDGMDEAAWYLGLIRQSELQSVLDRMQVESVLITEENYKMIGKGLHLSDYKAFLNK